MTGYPILQASTAKSSSAAAGLPMPAPSPSPSPAKTFAIPRSDSVEIDRLKKELASARAAPAPVHAPCASCASLGSELASVKQQLAAATAANVAAANTKCDKCASLTFQLAAAQQQSEDASKGKALSEFETERLRIRGLADQQVFTTPLFMA